MVTNLEIKNSLERDEVKEELTTLKKEVEEPIDRRIYLEVDSAFKEFTKETEAPHVRLEKLKDGKLRLKTYGEACELDLKSNYISFIKGGKVTLIEELTGSFDRGKYLRYSSLIKNYLLKEFRKMDIINKAVYVYKKHPNNKKFHFGYNSYGSKWSLRLDGEEIASSRELYDAGFENTGSRYKKERGDAQKKVVDILNKIVA